MLLINNTDMMNIFKRSPSKQNTQPSEANLLVKQFNDFNVEIHGTYEEPLFKAREIGDLLGIKNVRDTISNMDDQCKVK